jgi:hypothetical protein
MTDEFEEIDPAPVFGCALSLWKEFKKPSSDAGNVNVSECYNGGDEFMRVIMRVGICFEKWASQHIAFDHLDDVWPYLMETDFGATCLRVHGAMSLAKFNTDVCLRVALALRLPIRLDTSLPVPVEVIVPNPTIGSEFRALGIVTMRESSDGEDHDPLTVDDDPFDPEFEPPFFSLFGVDEGGGREHIADRETYAEAVNLACKLAPNIEFQFTLSFSEPRQPPE